MKGKKIDVKVKIFKETNKGRKGEYFYVKERKKKGRYYKKKEGITEKEAIEFYKRKIISKGKGITKERIKRERRLDRLQKKYPNIENELKSGYAENTIQDGKKITAHNISKMYSDLLKNKDKKGDKKAIVRDEELINILTRSENIEKWKHRVQYEVKAINGNEEILFTLTNKQPKLLGELKSDIIDQINLGEDYESLYKSDRKKQIENNGWKFNSGTTKKGKIAKLSIRMIFRKV